MLSRVAFSLKDAWNKAVDELERDKKRREDAKTKQTTRKRRRFNNISKTNGYHHIKLAEESSNELEKHISREVDETLVDTSNDYSKSQHYKPWGYLEDRIHVLQRLLLERDKEIVRLRAQLDKAKMPSTNWPENDGKDEQSSQIESSNPPEPDSGGVYRSSQDHLSAQAQVQPSKESFQSQHSSPSDAQHGPNTTQDPEITISPDVNLSLSHDSHDPSDPLEILSPLSLKDIENLI